MNSVTTEPLDATVGGRGDGVAVDAVGARVKVLREGAGLSLRDLAERSGVSATMLSQVERGDAQPDPVRGRQDRRRAGAQPVAAAAVGQGTTS